MSGVVINQMNHRQRRLAGKYSASALIEVMIADWIPFFECNHCGRWGSCPFGARPHAANPYRAYSDTQCGVATNALTEFVTRTFGTLLKASMTQRQRYVDAAHAFVNFIYHAEVQIGTLRSARMLDYYAHHVPLVFGQIAHLRTYLDQYAAALTDFDAFAAGADTLLVEGETELAFIETIQRSGFASLSGWHIDVYSGTGNRTPKRLQLLVDRLKARAHRVFIQGDSDGKGGDTFHQLKLACGIPDERTFAFVYDFETSVPAPLFVRSLSKVCAQLPAEPMVLEAAIADPTQPVGALLRSKFGLDIKPLKIRLARAIGEEVSAQLWFADRLFMRSELGRFLAFLERPATE